MCNSLWIYRHKFYLEQEFFPFLVRPSLAVLKFKIWPWLLVWPLVFSCQKSDKKAAATNVTRAFYYWQTSLSDLRLRDSTLQTMQVKKLYIRLFDVDWEEQTKRAIPVSPLQHEYFYDFIDSTTIIPVVFITNRTFTNLTEAQSRELAHKVHKKINSQVTRLIFGSYFSLSDDADYYDPKELEPYRHKAKDFHDQAKKDSIYQTRLKYFPEVQFDCDWTASTKTKYFAFFAKAKSMASSVAVSQACRAVTISI